MPRWRDYDDDDPYGRAWDNYYNQCNCEWYPGEDSDDEGYEERCDYCKREDAKAAAREAAQKAKADAEEARLRATGWYDELVVFRGFINRFNWLTGPEFFEARVGIFNEMFTAAAGYERFLAANPKFRTVLVGKLAECRASPRASVTLKDVMDRLDAVLERLPTVEGFKAE